jgi:hypothetical protein
MECSNVQVPRPRVSTSAGQSDGGVKEVVDDTVDEADVEEEEESLATFSFVRAAQLAKLVQLRQLMISVSQVDGGDGPEVADGLPSGPRTTPLGSFFGVVAVAETSF